MTEENQVRAITLDGNNYAIDTLSQEAKDVLVTLSENDQVANELKRTLKHVNVGAVALTNALRELLKDVEPLEVAEQPE